MNYVLDTNILIFAIRNSSTWERIKQEHVLTLGNSYISIVTKAEILSLAEQFSWGKSRIEKLEAIMQTLNIVPIDTNEIVKAYVEIDLYSQGKQPILKKPEGFTSKNMGKNDLWIAATAYLTGARLLSIDNDFQHLDKLFIDFVKIDWLLNQ